MPTKFYNLDTDSEFTSNSDQYIPSQRAVKTALDKKQNHLSVGENIIIENDTISSRATYRGIWDSSTNYLKGDLVFDVNNRPYLANHDNTNKDPNDSSNSLYWANLSDDAIKIQYRVNGDKEFPFIFGTGNSVTNLYYGDYDKEPTINGSTGVVNFPAGIKNYYNSTQIDTKFQEIESLIQTISATLDNINGEII